MSLPDVVYPVRPGEDNEELRYSLRSLRNVPHRRVWIAGFVPSWVTNVGKLPVPFRHGNKIRNVKANFSAACMAEGVAETFYVFNDDMFVMHEVDQIPTVHLGPLEAYIGRIKPGLYADSLANTLAYLKRKGHEEPLAYNAHSPILVRKADFAETLRTIEMYLPPRTSIMSMYGNLYKIGGHRSGNAKNPRVNDRLIISTNDRSFREDEAGAFIRRRFSDPSPYER